jgi:uncharacterized protein with PIN domain
MWVYVPDRKMSAAQMRDMPKLRACLACAAKLLRIAEREAEEPYRWFPTGYICSKCNTMYMGVP